MASKRVKAPERVYVQFTGTVPTHTATSRTAKLCGLCDQTWHEYRLVTPPKKRRARR